MSCEHVWILESREMSPGPWIVRGVWETFRCSRCLKTKEIERKVDTAVYPLPVRVP